MTGYIIYYQQEEGGQRLSESAGAAATTAFITGLITGATYSITMVATSSTLPSTETAALTVTIGTVYMCCVYIRVCTMYNNTMYLYKDTFTYTCIYRAVKHVICF